MNGFLRVAAWITVIVGALCAIGYYTYADVWVVPNDDPRMTVSLEPTLRAGDLVLVERQSSHDLGKLVRCADPDEPRRFVTGRMAGPGGTAFTLLDQRFVTPGSRERSDTSCGDVRIVNPATGDEVPLECNERDFAGLNYRTLTRREGDPSGSTVEQHVPSGKAFLLSDDRYLHFDSRDYGLVDEPTCQRVFFRLWGGNGFSDASRRFSIIW